MSNPATFEAYRQLYKKYAPDLSKEEIEKKVLYAGNRQDQDEMIKAFYNKYTGSDPSDRALVGVNRYINPEANKAFFEKSKKEYDAAVADRKKAQEELEAANKLKADERETKVNEMWDKYYRFSRFDDFREGDYWSDKDKAKVEEHVKTLSSEDKYKLLLDWDKEVAEAAVGDGEEVGTLEKWGDVIGNNFNWWTNLTGNLFDEGTTFQESILKADAQKMLDERQDEKDYQLKRLGSVNAINIRTAEIEKEILELQKQQEGLEKDSEKFLELENNIKNLKADKPNLLRQSEVKQREDFFDAYNKLVGAGDDFTGNEGEGANFLGESFNDNFLTLEEFETAGWNPDQYETFKALNNINKDMFKLDDLMKSTKAWDDIDENGEIVQLLERNNLTLDDLNKL